MNVFAKKEGIYNRELGIGLIELLVSMFVGLFIMAGVVQMVGSTSQNAISNSGIARIQENARYVFSRIEDDLMRAGNAGCFNTALGHELTLRKHNNIQPRNLPAGSVKVVDSVLKNKNGINELYDYHNFIGGHDDLPDSSDLGSKGTDSFVLRLTDQSARFRIDAIDNGAGTLSLNADSVARLNGANIKSNQVVTISDCNRSVALMVASVSGASVTWNTSPSSTTVNNGQENSQVHLGFADVAGQDSALYLYAGDTGASRYFIDTSVRAKINSNSCEPTSDVGKTYCALYRVVDGAGQEIVEGVHDMQILYGHYDAAGELLFSEADEITSLGGLAADNAWNSVNRLRISLTFNSIEPVLTQQDSKGTVLDKEFVRTVVLFNQR